MPDIPSVVSLQTSRNHRYFKTKSSKPEWLAAMSYKISNNNQFDYAII